MGFWGGGGCQHFMMRSAWRGGHVARATWVEPSDVEGLKMNPPFPGLDRGAPHGAFKEIVGAGFAEGCKWEDRNAAKWSQGGDGGDCWQFFPCMCGRWVWGLQRGWVGKSAPEQVLSVRRGASASSSLLEHGVVIVHESLLGEGGGGPQVPLHSK